MEQSPKNRSKQGTGLLNIWNRYRVPFFMILVALLLAAVYFSISESKTILLPVALWVMGATPLVSGIVYRDRIRSVWLFDAVSILILILFLEAGLRVGPFENRFYSANVGPETSWHPYLFWIEKQKVGNDEKVGIIKPPPIRKVEHESDLVEFLFQRSSHDPFRFRSGPVEKTKPPGQFRILVIGGSNAYGYGVALYEHSFSNRLEKLLKERHPQKNIEVICVAARGYNLYQNLTFYKLHLRKFQPDLVILYANMIDSATSKGPFTFRELFLMRSGVDIADLWITEHEFPKKPTALIAFQDKLRKSRIYSLLANWVTSLRDRNDFGGDDEDAIKEVNPLPDYRKNLVDLIRIVQKDGARMICADEFNFSRIGSEKGRASQIQKIMEETSKKSGCLYVPVHEILASTKEPKQYIFFPVELDHINIEGHKKVAEILFQAIETQNLIR